MWRNIASNALTVFIVLLLAAAGIAAWGQQQYKGEGPLATAVCVQVPPEARFRSFADQLEDKGAISSAMLFRVGAEYEGKSGLLKAGSFLVPPGASMSEVLDIITRGGRSTCGIEVIYQIGVNANEIDVRELDPETNRFKVVMEFDPLSGEAPADYAAVRERADTRYRVSLAEGVTSWQVVNALKGADFMSGELGDVPPEGTLAPESYEVTSGADRGALIGQMQALQSQRLDAAWQNRADDLPISTPEEALILASIIEKETGVPEERGQVASVFVNRLKKSMRLQTDPTVIYGVTEGKGVLGRGLRQSELRRETAWNTYVIDGLPKTPIANPGLASIEAALNPAATDFIYFVADGSGGHVFSTNLDEHNTNVAKCRELKIC